MRGKQACSPSPALYGLILAAGFSSRMGGRSKALRDPGAGTMLEMAVNAFRDAGIDQILVVTGHEAAQVAAAALSLKAEPIFNPDVTQGMFSSLCAGLAHLYAGERRADPSAVFVLPVDACLVESWTIASLAQCWLSQAERNPEQAERTVLIPCFGGRSGHPPLLGATHARRLLQERGQLKAQQGLRSYIASLLPENALGSFRLGRLPEHGEGASRKGTGGAPVLLPSCPAVRTGRADSPVIFLPLPDAGILMDLDTPEDCARARDFLSLTRNRRLPSPEEAGEWLHCAGLPKGKLLHNIRVALGAVALGRALACAGMEIDLPLHACGGLLHDIVYTCRMTDAKCKSHARRGRNMLLARGWRECALVVGAHTVLPDSMLAALGIGPGDMPVICRKKTGCPEAIRGVRAYGGASGAAAAQAPAGQTLLHACVAVYLADKYFFMDTPVSLEERFNIIADRYRGNAEATQAIRRRKSVAVAVENWFFSVTGVTPEESMAGFCSPPPAARASSPEAAWEQYLADLLEGQAK